MLGMVLWRDTAATATTLAFMFCLTICIFTDYPDSSTCTALGNRNFAFEELLQVLTGSYRRQGRRYIRHIFAKGRVSMTDDGRWKERSTLPNLHLYIFALAKGHACNSALQLASLEGFNRAFRIRRSSSLIHVRCFSVGWRPSHATESACKL